MINDDVKHDMLKLSVESELLADALKLQSEAFDFFVDTEDDKYVQATAEAVVERLKSYIEAMNRVNGSVFKRKLL